MSAANSVKTKTNCDAVKSGHFISKQIINSRTSNAIKNANHGAKLNKIQEPIVFKQEPITSPLKQESSLSSEDFHSQKLCDVQKVLKQEQELQKNIYQSNNAPGWLRVNHNNKVIYISPSGIGLASLKQVKDYLLTRGTCKCGLPFPLRVELFFNFNTEVPTVPLKTPIESIKFDPNCQHRKRLTSNQTAAQNQTDIKRGKIESNTKRVTGECLLPSYVTSASSKVINQNTTNNTVMIVNNSGLTSSNVQPQIIQSKPQQVTFQQQRPQQQQFVQHDPTTGANVVMRIIKDDSVESDGVKLPPWKKNSINQQKNIQPTQILSSGIPIFQINGQNVIAIDQNNQQFQIQQPQQIQIIEQKCDGNEIAQWSTGEGKIGKTIIRRRPTFKEDPTGYLNQQTALLHNTITTLHSPDGSSSTTSSASPALQETSSENFQKSQRQQFLQYMRSSPVTSLGGQTLTHMPNGVVQIQQNCDIKPLQAKPVMIQEQMKYVRQNPKGRPPKNPQTIAKRLVAMSQESPVSSTSAGSGMKIIKSNTPDISSSSHTPDAVTETIVQSSTYDNAEFVKLARTASTQELIRTSSMTQVVAGKAITNITAAASGNIVRKAPPTMTMMKKPQQTSSIIGQVKSNGNVAGNQQIMMTSNGQQFVVVPSNNAPQQQPQNIMLNNNSLLQQLQSTNANSQRLVQGPNGNFIIQTSTGNVLTNPITGGNFIVSNNQSMNPLIIQNGQIIQNTGNLMSPKGNILLSTAGNGSTGKTILTNGNQLTSPLMTQQTVLINGIPSQVMMPATQAIIQDNSIVQHQQQQQQQARTPQISPEKKKGRKRKIPLPESQQQQVSNIQQQNQQTTVTTVPQQSGMIQVTPQGFQLASPNIIVQNKPQQPQQPQQIILQNGQTLIQQPMNLLGGQQLMLPSGHFPVMMTPDGNSIVQFQNPTTFNNIIQTPQGMMIRAPIQQQQQQQQQAQKTIITSNGQQFIVNQGGQMNQVFNTPMGFILQTQQQNQQHQQHQIINTQQPIMMQSSGMNQPQIITQSTSGVGGQSALIGQQTQFITQQTDGKTNNSNSSQRKIIHHQKVQQQKFYPQMIKSPRVKSSIQTIVQEIEQLEDDEEEVMIADDDEQEEVCEEIEQEEQEMFFDSDKPDMIQELHHGSQQVLHHSMTGDGQCGIMNIDDITIEMDEINDLNEYLNAIDEEDNRMAQMGMSSLQQFANSPPDTTTHSPRSPIHATSEKSNGSSDSTNMVQFVSSSEPDSNSNVVSPEAIDSQMSPPQNQIQYSGNSQPMFKLPMDPKATSKSPMTTNIMSQNHLNILMDRSQKSPLMRPDSHETKRKFTESASSDHRSESPFDEMSSKLIDDDDDEIENDDEDVTEKKSDFDLLKESPPVNTIKPVATDVIESEDSLSGSPNSPLPTTNSTGESQSNSNFKVGDLIWGATRGCDAWPGKIVNGPDGEPTSSDCVWVKWFGGRQNTEMVLCSTLKSLSDGLEAHHAAQKDTRKGRKLNSHLERAIQKAMTELDKQSNPSTSKGISEKKSVTSSLKSSKTKLIKIAPAPDKK